MKEIHTRDDFYLLIENSGQVSNDSHARTQWLSRELSKLSDSSIVNFERFFREELVKLYNYNIMLLFELNYPSPILTRNGQVIEMDEPYLSTDGFIYFRCGIILLGQEAVDRLVKDPEYIMLIVDPGEEIDAEGMLYVSADALQKKRSAIDINENIGMDTHYDSGKFSVSGNKIEWHNPEKVSPPLVKFFRYHRTTMEMPDKLPTGY